MAAKARKRLKKGHGAEAVGDVKAMAPLADHDAGGDAPAAAVSKSRGRGRGRGKAAKKPKPEEVHDAVDKSSLLHGTVVGRVWLGGRACGVGVGAAA